MARHAPSALRLPRPLAGEALYDVEAHDAGVRRALRARQALLGITALREADGWAQALLAWSGRWDALLSETSVGEDCRPRLVHERLVKARRSLVRLAAPARSSLTSTRGWSATGRCPPPATALREASTPG